MPVPGLTAELPVKAKVRVGERKQINGRMLPTSTDHFVCDDPVFTSIAGEEPKSIRVHFAYATWEEAFPSGLERWVKTKSGQSLTCYTKGDGMAHRLTKGEKAPDGTWKIDPTPGCERRDMPCAAQACVYFGKGKTQGCRPQARLNFQLVGGPKDSVYRFETKGLHSIEKIQGVLEQYPDLRGREFDLTVTMVKKANHEFPVVTISEVKGNTLATQPATDRENFLDYLEQTGRKLPLSKEQKHWVIRVGHKRALEVLRERDGADE